MTIKLNWPLEQVWAKIQPFWPDFSIEYIHEIDSTNTQLLHRIRNGQTSPLMLVANSQTAGKARMGKSWSSRVGDSLTFSLAVPISSLNIGCLSLAIGCALIQALNKNASDEKQTFKIKWPNDIWLMPQNKTQQPQWHKVAGILIETLTHLHQRYAVIGIGININAPPQQHEYSIPVGYLKQLSTNWNVLKAFVCIAPEIAQAVYNFEKHGFEPWRTFFKQHDLLLGTPLYTSNGVQGIGAGVDPQGHLLVKTENGVQTIHSGEVSVRPC